MSGKKIYTEIESCRVCKNQKLISVLNLGSQALTGVFPKTRKDIVPAGPIELVLCSGKSACGLVQLKHSYDASLMYGENYGYRSGLNSSMVEHLHKKVKKIEQLLSLKSGDIVLDIGSNDGTTLKFYQNLSLNLIGVDPSAEKFRKFYLAILN